MKQTIILIGALILTLVISGPALADTIQGSNQSLGGTVGAAMTDINLSPQVGLDYEGAADEFAMAGWNTKGNRVFACNSDDNNIYYQDVPEDSWTTQLAFGYDSWVAASNDVLADSDTWIKLGSSN